MKIALLGQFASMKIFIFILVYLKDLQVILPDVLSTTTYGYQTAIAFGLNSSGGHRGANDLVSEIFRHVTGHHSSVVMDGPGLKAQAQPGPALQSPGQARPKPYTQALV